PITLPRNLEFDPTLAAVSLNPLIVLIASLSLVRGKASWGIPLMLPFLAGAFWQHQDPGAGGGLDLRSFHWLMVPLVVIAAPSVIQVIREATARGFAAAGPKLVVLGIAASLIAVPAVGGFYYVSAFAYTPGDEAMYSWTAAEVSDDVVVIAGG